MNLKKQQYVITFLWVMTSLFSSFAFANPPESDWLGNLLQKFGGSETVDPKNGIDWGVLPGPFVNPLQGVGIGVAAIGLYSPEHREKQTQLSTLSIKSYASSSGSFGLGIENSTYFGDDTWRADLNAWLSHSPQNYWGVGISNAENNDLKTEINTDIVDIKPKVSYRLLPYTYLSLNWQLTHYGNIKSTGTALSIQDKQNSQVSGIGIGIAYDSRDFAPNPDKGMLASINYNHYAKTLGSSYNFERITFNYRYFYRFTPSWLIAYDLYGQGNQGNIPWYAMSQVGINGRMRGYYQGQYRDKYQLNTQVELRQQFTQRHGFVYWLGAGNIANRSQQLFSNNWLPTAGIGYRLAFKPKVNIRLDFGFGKHSNGFYFQINEAF